MTNERAAQLDMQAKILLSALNIPLHCDDYQLKAVELVLANEAILQQQAVIDHMTEVRS